MMPFLLAEFANREDTLPLYVCCIGSHEQRRIERMNGFSAHQIFLCRSGAGVFRFPDKPDLTLTEGSVLVLPADTPHIYFPLDSEEGWVLGFTGFHGKASAAFIEMMGPLSTAAFKPGNFLDLWKQLEDLWHLIHLNSGNVIWESSKRLYAMTLSLLESRMAGDRPRSQELRKETANSALETAVSLMHAHFNERLLISHIARASGYSVQHFNRLFRSYYGETPQQYLLHLRLRRARQLFRDIHGITVEEVAQQLGMECSYFIRMFKRKYHITPKQFVKHPSQPDTD
jgi:AraC-like DNA-binding protein